MSSVASKPSYIRSLKVCPFKAIVSYTSKSLNLIDLSSGNMVEMLNLFNINDLKMDVKEFEVRQKLTNEEVLKYIVKFYKNDLVKN
mmetsp:Transcript_39343/g.37771  ORF Transcript_39343/g.37771 Transcript_39343/m.37771 type:complete len:86 (-) Transcript_39343:271-528(-)